MKQRDKRKRRVEQSAMDLIQEDSEEIKTESSRLNSFKKDEIIDFDIELQNIQMHPKTLKPDPKYIKDNPFSKIGDSVIEEVKSRVGE
jgi:hypothetical protein